MRLLAAATLALAAAAPAAAQDCPAAGEPGAAELAALQQTIRAEILAESPADSAGYVVLDVNPAASRGHVVFASVNVSEALRGRIIQRLGEHLEKHPASGTRFFRVAPRPGEDACGGDARNPALTNAAKLTREIRALEREYHARTGRRLLAGEAAVGVLVTAEGRNALVLVKKRSGNEWLDERLTRIAQGLRFRPAVVEGRPVDVWVNVPLDVWGNLPLAVRSPGQALDGLGRSARPETPEQRRQRESRSPAAPPRRP